MATSLLFLVLIAKGVYMNRVISEHFEKSQAIIDLIQTKLDGQFICYWMIDGCSISSEDLLPIYEMTQNNLAKSKKLYIFIKSNGGSGLAALEIINMLRGYYNELVVLAPLNCASAGTMLALGANSIHMGPLSTLSPVDTAVLQNLTPTSDKNNSTYISTDEIDRIVNLWKQHSDKKESNLYNDLSSYIHPLVFGAVERANTLSLEICEELLSFHMNDKDKIWSICNKLNGDYPAHGYPISLKQAKKLGLSVEKIDTDIHDNLIELNSIYSEMSERKKTYYNFDRYHQSEVLTIVETMKKQLYYALDEDVYINREKKTSHILNDKSGWIKKEIKNEHLLDSHFYIN